MSLAGCNSHDAPHVQTLTSPDGRFAAELRDWGEGQEVIVRDLEKTNAEHKALDIYSCKGGDLSWMSKDELLISFDEIEGNLVSTLPSEVVSVRLCDRSVCHVAVGGVPHLRMKGCS
jgi:hypothetical protein